MAKNDGNGEGGYGLHLLCAKCNLSVPLFQYDKHERDHLSYLAYKCGLCKVRFYTFTDAQAHFSPFSRVHPGNPPPNIIEELDLRLEQEITQTISRAVQAATPPAPPPQTLPSTSPSIISQSAKPPATPAETSDVQQPENIRCDKEKADTPETSEESEHSLASRPPSVPPPPSPALPGSEHSEAESESSFELPLDSSATTPKKEEPTCPVTKNKTTAPPAKRPRLPAKPDSEGTSQSHATDFDKKQSVSSRRGYRWHCRLCQKEVKARPNDHIATDHIKKAIYRCCLCQHEVYRWGPGNMVRHIETRHPFHSKDSFVDNRNEDLAREFDIWHKRCVPSSVPTSASTPNPTTKAPKDAEKKCLLCLETVKSEHQRGHIIYKHLGRPTHSCHLCNFRAFHATVRPIQDHMASMHPTAQSEYVDDSEALGEEIGSLCREAFSPEPTSAVVVSSTVPPSPPPGASPPPSRGDERGGRKVMEPVTEEWVRGWVFEEDSGVRECRECGVVVGPESRWRAAHIMEAHLRRPRIVCLLCGFKDFTWTNNHIRTHMKKAHGRAFDLRNQDETRDYLAQLQPAMVDQMRKCFNRKFAIHKNVVNRNGL